MTIKKENPRCGNIPQSVACIKTKRNNALSCRGCGYNNGFIIRAKNKKEEGKKKILFN